MGGYESVQRLFINFMTVIFIKAKAYSLIEGYDPSKDYDENDLEEILKGWCKKTAFNMSAVLLVWSAAAFAAPLFKNFPESYVITLYTKLANFWLLLCALITEKANKIL